MLLLPLEIWYQRRLLFYCYRRNAYLVFRPTVPCRQNRCRKQETRRGKLETFSICNCHHWTFSLSFQMICSKQSKKGYFWPQNSICTWLINVLNTRPKGTQSPILPKGVWMSKFTIVRQSNKATNGAKLLRITGN